LKAKLKLVRWIRRERTERIEVRTVCVRQNKETVVHRFTVSYLSF
jgi:hypothetical protein